MSDYYDRSGKPITVNEWAALYTEENKRVASDYVGDVHISTVWLGVNHNWRGKGAPLIFETMIFGGPLDEEQWRYPTEDEARVGHVEALRLAQESANA